MIKENRNIEQRVNIDQAWDTVYNRFRVDGLLDVAKKERAVVKFSSTIKWAAAIIIFFLAGTTGLYFMVNSPNNASLLSLYNNDHANTLVSTMEDGSIIYLVGGASISYPVNFAPDKREISLQGEALFDITSNKECPFFIDTEPVIIEVLGTSFNIKSLGKEFFELSVQRGTVQVHLKTGNSTMIVNAGETVQLQSGQLLKSLSGNSEQFVNYTKKMSFKDERIDNMFRVIGNMNNQAIVLTDPDLSHHRLTVAFTDNTTESMVELICQALNLTYSEQQDTIFVSQP